ncbi:hypothetical protein HPK19_03370 [Arthrobacter citreus]|nr:hypothetical protein HPK19_03370 [Arthrobacter citreus]
MKKQTFDERLEESIEEYRNQVDALKNIPKKRRNKEQTLEEKINETVEKGREKSEE